MNKFYEEEIIQSDKEIFKIDNAEIYDKLKRNLFLIPIDNENNNNNNNIDNDNKNDNENDKIGDDNFSFFNSKKIHNSFNSILTEISIDIGNEKLNFEISFKNDKNEFNNNINKNKELKKESIEILNNFISKENWIISKDNIIIENNKNKNINSFKKIKKNILSLDDKMTLYFKKPFMRKNLKKLKDINTNVYKEVKIKCNKGKIKMENIDDCYIREIDYE